MISKIVAITGANKGIGYATVKKLLQETNFQIILTARNAELGQNAVNQLLQELPTVKGRVSFHQLDIVSDQSIIEFANFIKQNYGQIDVLLNNAGMAFKGPQFDSNIVRTTFKTNFFGTIKMCDVMLPLIKDSGHLINVTSMAGLASAITDPTLKGRIIDPNLTREQLFALADEYQTLVDAGNHESKGWKSQGYATSKLLLNAFTGVLHRELRAQGRSLRINSLCPGWVKTDMAGPNAALTLEEGAVVPAFLVCYEGQESGQFWRNSKIFDWINGQK